MGSIGLADEQEPQEELRPVLQSQRLLSSQLCLNIHADLEEETHS